MNCRIRNRGRDSWAHAGKVKTAAQAALALSMALTLSACGPSAEQMRLNRAMYGARHEIYPDYRDCLEILERYRTDERHENEFVQYGMCETSLATLGGRYDLADAVGKHSHLAVKKYQDADRETLAAMGDEAVKFFKGEPHERALLAFYTGLACYVRGEYNDARIFFTQSIMASQTRDEDMADFREDFRLGHFWRGRAHLRLGQEDSARIALGKAGHRMFHGGEQKDIERLRANRERARKDELKGEEICYKKGTTGKDTVEGIMDLSTGRNRSEMPEVLPEAADDDPTELSADALDAFLQPDFQAKVNLIIVLESGYGPVKYVHGPSQAFDDYMRMEYKGKGADVYVDGHRSGPTFCLLDTYHQAVTRGVQTRRGRQTTKAVTREILKQLPYISWVASAWSVKADQRYWTSLPGEIHVFAARVTPGLHDIALRFYDINGAHLPRFDLVRHYIYVPEEDERVLVLRSVENQDNAYLLGQITSK